MPGIAAVGHGDRNQGGHNAGGASAKPALIPAFSLPSFFGVVGARPAERQRRHRGKEGVPERVDGKMKEEECSKNNLQNGCALPSMSHPNHYCSDEPHL